MYAVIKAGGKQHKVKAGDVLEIELTHGAEGEAITFNPLLVVDDDGVTYFGKDAAKAVVKAKLVGEQKGEKVRVFKYRPKTGYAKRQGHRQQYTLIEIQDVSMGAGQSASKAAGATKEPVSRKSPPKSAAPAETKAADEPNDAPKDAPSKAGESAGPSDG
jgi:large subunit ribosomal protein L21